MAYTLVLPQIVASSCSTQSHVSGDKLAVFAIIIALCALAISLSQLHYSRADESVKPLQTLRSPQLRGRPGNEIYIPSREADVLGFGILPGLASLKIPDFKVGTFDEICATVNVLDSSHKASRKLRDIKNLLGEKWNGQCTYGFLDIIALAAPMIRHRKSTIIRLPAPAYYCSSLLFHKEGFVVFHNRLREYLAAQPKNGMSSQAHWVVEQYERLMMRHIQWENEGRMHRSQWDDGRQIDHEKSLEFLEDVHDCWDAATEYFLRIQDAHELQYRELMASHISHAVKYWGDAWKHLRENEARESYGLRALETEGTHLYFDYLPRIVADMRTRGYNCDEQIIYDAWFTMMFRGFCWWRCHSVYPAKHQAYEGSTIPSQS